MRINRSFIHLCIAAITITLLAEKPLHARMRHVRAQDPMLAHLLAAGYHSSPTLQHIIDRLERFDVIVHVVAGPFQWRRGAGAMQFVTHAGGIRYLRITLSGQMSSSATIGLLAHELQHALEVALEPSVVDTVTLAALYRRIGDERGTGRQAVRYDTEGARETGRYVLLELRGVSYARAVRETSRP